MSLESDNYLLSHQLLRRGLLIEQSPLGITLSDNALLKTKFDYQLESTSIENVIVQEQLLTE